MLKKGIFIFDKLYEFKLGAFICDSPARAYLKCIKSHNGYSSCGKCDASGMYLNNRMCFPTIGRLRDDLSLKLKSDEDHH